MATFCKRQMAHNDVQAATNKRPEQSIFELGARAKPV